MSNQRSLNLTGLPYPAALGLKNGSWFPGYGLLASWKMSVEMAKPKSVILLSAVALLAVAGSPTIADSQGISQPAAKAHGPVGSGPRVGGRAEPRGRAFSGRGFGGGALGGGALRGGRSGFSDDSRSSRPGHSDPIPGPSQPGQSDAASAPGNQSGRASDGQTGRNSPAGRSGRGSRAGGIEGGSDRVGSHGAGRGDQTGRQSIHA